MTDPCHSEHEPVDVDHLLKLAKTRDDLAELVRMLHRRNLQLQQVRDNLAHQLHTARQETR